MISLVNIVTKVTLHHILTTLLALITLQICMYFSMFWYVIMS